MRVMSVRGSLASRRSKTEKREVPKEGEWEGLKKVPKEGLVASTRSGQEFLADHDALE